MAYVPDLEDFLKWGGGSGLEGMGGRQYRKTPEANRHIHNTSQAVCAVQKRADRGHHGQTPQVPSSPRLVSTPHIRRLLPSPHKLPSSLSGLLAPGKDLPPLPFPRASPSGSDTRHQATLLTRLGLQHPHLATQDSCCVACFPLPGAFWTEFIKKKGKEWKERRERKPPLNLIF